MPETEVLVKNCRQERVDEKRLIQAAKKSLQVEQFRQSAEISIVLVDDERIHELNRRYRTVDRPTDVLAFAQLDDAPAQTPAVPVTLGDVVISVETARRQADERGRSLEDELDLLVVHGILHLLGYNDETEAEAAEMRLREKAILDQMEDNNR